MSGSAIKNMVSMPVSLRLMSAILRSYSKSVILRTPRTIYFAPYCLAKSVVREL